MNVVLHRIVLLSALIIALFSCEGLAGGKANVYDAETLKPIDSVQVVHYLREEKPYDTTFTDLKGAFDATIFVGCVPKCPIAKVVLTKKGYYPSTYIFRERKNNPKKPKGIKIFMRKKK